MRLSAILIQLSLPLVLTACSVGGTVSGTVTDAVTGQPRTEVRVIAQSEGVTDLTCQVMEANTDATGAFTLPKLCSGVSYKLSLSDEGLLLGDVPSVDGSVPTSTVALQAWRVPKGSGVFILDDDKLSTVRTFTDIKQEVSATDENLKITYPYMKPTKLSYVVEPGSFFVVSGQSNVDRLEYRPLISDPGKRTFRDGSIENHAWVGARFTTETEWEPVELQVDAGKVKELKMGEKVVRYLASDALPEGRYAIFGDEDARMYIVDFGKSQDAPEAAAEAEAEAPAAPAGEMAAGG